MPCIFYEKGTKTPDFNSLPLCQCVGHFIEKQVNDRLSFRFEQVVRIFQRLDQIDFVHSLEAPADLFGFEM